MSYILITGGSGYIGSHTAIELVQAGYTPLIVDNLSNSNPAILSRLETLCHRSIPFFQIDLRDKEALQSLFRDYTISAVIHFAALKAVGESVEKPLEYYDNNLISTLYLLETMREFGVRHLVHSSSATVYGLSEDVPFQEDSPVSATNPYGQTKVMIEQILQDLFTSDPNWNIVRLRYFNPIGAHPSGTIGEDPNGIPNNLLPYITQVAIGKLPELRVFGDDYPTPDGTGIRDYIHVVDLARAHVYALEKSLQSQGLFTYNLGTGIGYSVLDLVHTFEEVNHVRIPYTITPRRAGDIAISYADPSLAKQELHWEAQLNLQDMCRDAWNWQKQNPNGF